MTVARPYMDVLLLSTQSRQSTRSSSRELDKPESVFSWSRIGGELVQNFSKLEIFQNWFQTSSEPLSTDPEPTQNRSRTVQIQFRAGCLHSESDSSGAVSSRTTLFRRLAAAALARCSSSRWAFLWREKLDECMKVLLQAAQV